MTNTAASTMPALTENQQIIWENILRQQKHNALAIMVGEPRRVYTRLCQRLKGTEFLDFVLALTQSIDIDEEVSHFLSLCGPNGEEWIRGLMNDSGELSIMVTGVSSDILIVSVETFLGVMRRIRSDLAGALNCLLAHHGDNLGKKNFGVFAMMKQRLETAGGVLQSLAEVIGQIGADDDDISVHATIQETLKPIARKRNPTLSARTMDTDESSSSDESGSKSKPLVSIEVNWTKVTAPARFAKRAAKYAAKTVKEVTVNVVVNPTVATTRAVAHAASVTVDTVAVQPAKYMGGKVSACASATANGAKKLWKKPGKTLARAFIPQSVRRKMVEALRDDGSSMMAPQQ